MGALVDGFGRRLTYLRVSVTDRCNMRCLYCMPQSGVPLVEHGDLLTYEEIVRIVRVGARLGIRAVRLTGGEPLVRRDLVDLVRALSSIPGIEDISLTTNASLLEGMAHRLREAGLKRVNVSLDSLDPARFAIITGGGDLAAVLKGIDSALDAGLSPVKVNCVVLKGLNESEIPRFLDMAASKAIHIRFIELMPVGWNRAWFDERFIPAAQVREVVERDLRTRGWWLRQAARGRGLGKGMGPAACYDIVEDRDHVAGTPGGCRVIGTVGFISAITEHFCGACNRMRLTSVGRLSPCLASGVEVDLKGALRGGCADAEIETLFRQAASAKPAGHHMECAAGLDRRLMSRIGG